MTEEKKSSGAGKFILGAAIGALVGAVAGKFISTKEPDDECDCGGDCECGDDCVCDNCDCDKKCKDKEKAPKASPKAKK